MKDRPSIQVVGNAKMEHLETVESMAIAASFCAPDVIASQIGPDIPPRPWWMRYQVPELKLVAKGLWWMERAEIKRFVPADDERLQQLLPIGTHRKRYPIWPGVYTMLKRLHDAPKEPSKLKVVTWMSDHPNEIGEQVEAIEAIRPGMRVLMGGLGLGVMVKAALDRDAAHVDVIERDQDIIDMIATQYSDSRVHVHAGDVKTWPIQSGVRWDVTWMDIWPTVSAENIPSMMRVRHRYLDVSDWYGAWCARECLADMRERLRDRLNIDQIDRTRKRLGL